MWGIELENRLKCNRKSRIFWKVFIVNIVMLLMIVIIAYLLLYYLLPSFYKNYKIKEFRQLSSELIGQIKDEQKETEALFSFVLIKFFVSRGSFAYKARVMASKIVDFPLPVGPKMPKSPCEVSVSKSMICSSR